LNSKDFDSIKLIEIEGACGLAAKYTFNYTEDRESNS